MSNTGKIIALVSLTVLILAAHPGTAQTADPVRAPEVLPGCTAEMNDPAFWIQRIENPDRVIMTPSQIAEFNRKNAERTYAADHPYAKNIAEIERDGPVFTLMRPLEAGDRFDAAVVRSRLEQNDRRLDRKTLYDRWALPLTDMKKNEIRTAVNLAALPPVIKPRTGIIVHHTSARLYPTSEPGYAMRNYLDDINVTSLDIGMPVAVMHVSKENDYFFVMSPIAWGWIPAADMAFAAPTKIAKFDGAKKFIVVSDHRRPFYSDPEYAAHAGYLFMGERLPLEGRSGDGYRVLVPVRRHDGSLAAEKAWIRADETVHEGFLPYTQRNVIATAFRLLGRPYGWHDSWEERDCGGILRVIFNCFGFTFPRYWSFEQLHSDHAQYVGNISDPAEKTKMLTALPAGITFTGSTGHIGLYLGSVDSKPFVIHQCGWNYKQGDTEYKMARVVVSDYENVGFTMKSLGFFTPILP
jgi:hypothetical protein